MFQFIRDLYRRHQKKLLITSGVAAISYLISIYVRNKINEFQEQLKEENLTRDLIKKRFSQTQKDCYMTFLSFLPVLVDPIFKELDVEEITKELKLSRKNKNLINNDGKSELNSEDLSSKQEGSIVIENEGSNDNNNNNNNNNSISGIGKSKNELWQELKIKSLTRFLTLIYSETLFIILLHLQLNIISRKSYLKTALKLASKKQSIKLIDLEIEDNNNLNLNDKDLSEQAFLSFTWWLLNKGWIKLKDIINESVENVFNEINLRDEMNIEEFGKLLFEIQKNIDNKLFEERYDYELYDNIEINSNNNNDESNNIKMIRLISLILPSNSKDELELLEKTNTMEFISKFNSNLVNSATLCKMNDELKGYLKSEQVNMISKTISATGISVILENVEQTLFLKQENKRRDKGEEGKGEGEEKGMLINEKWKLAFILAVLTPQTQELANRRLDNKVLYMMNNVRELDDLSASVYSNFDV
ncbi:peroxin [Pichia californica]|uniref:Peroxin-3 n=1 Tax=Pichia californica TaxID=460514 RepID=A0A9P6WIF3_9ASCO|nr:peroxin [[Candida] californica]KAG0687700.1 peroxin [[Candida] californica]